MFNEIDADGNGYITPEEVVVGFTKMGAPVTIEEAKEIVKKSDTDGDGRVSYVGKLHSFYTSIHVKRTFKDR